MSISANPTLSIEEQHTQRLLQQRVKIQKEHERIFHRHMRNQYMKHVNNCFLDEDCPVEYVYDIFDRHNLSIFGLEYRSGDFTLQIASIIRFMIHTMFGLRV